MKRIKTSLIMMLIIAVFTMLLAVDARAYVIKQQWVRFSATAGETLTTGQIVAIKDADGYAYKADSDAATLRPAVGIIGKGGTSGQTVEIIVVGIVSGWTGLSEGQNGYLSETAGAITQSAPAWNQQVGVAISTTEYLINCKNYLDTSALTTLGVLSGASPLVFEGATADDFETTVAVTDPTADRTITIPDASGTPVLSTLATNAPDVANSVTGASNGLVFEGATADAHETTITPTDPTADRTITLPDASGVPILATAVPDAANAVSGANNSLVFEGATADDFETTVAVTDPTADRTITIPDASGTPVLSTLATNAPDVANSVTGASNGLVFEGATADAHETTITPTDPTADRTITLPDASGTVSITGTNGAASHDYAAGHADWSVSALEAEATYIAATNADQAVNALLASCRAGKQYFVYNNSTQILTFKVTGQAGGTIANGKVALYICNGTDVVELYEQP